MAVSRREHHVSGHGVHAIGVHQQQRRRRQQQPPGAVIEPVVCHYRQPQRAGSARRRIDAAIGIAEVATQGEAVFVSEAQPRGVGLRQLPLIYVAAQRPSVGGLYLYHGQGGIKESHLPRPLGVAAEEIAIARGVSGYDVIAGGHHHRHTVSAEREMLSDTDAGKG